ncbi:MAG: cytochrome c [Bacteroidota bacterium]
MKKKGFKFLMAGIAISVLIHAACQPSYPQGQAIYERYCASCHMKSGEGLRGLIPPLAQADYLKNHREKLPCIIRYGLEGPIQVNGKTYNQPMAAIPDLNETEIHNLLNYLSQAWENDLPYFSPKEIETSLDKCN